MIIYLAMVSNMLTGFVRHVQCPRSYRDYRLLWLLTCKCRIVRLLLLHEDCQTCLHTARISAASSILWKMTTHTTQLARHRKAKHNTRVMRMRLGRFVSDGLEF
jgi:hypothetical protein